MRGLKYINPKHLLNLPALCLLLVCSLPVFAATDAVVLGSFLSEQYALEHRDRLRQQFKPKLNIEVVASPHGSSTNYRVIFRADDPAILRQVLTQAQKLGISDAWISRIQTGRVEPAPQPLVAKPPNPPTAPTAKSAEQPTTPRTAPTAKPAEQRTTPGIEASAQPPPVGNLTLSPNGTEVDITLPKLTEGDFDFALDGKLQETVWQTIPGYDNLTITDPDTMGKPRFATVQKWFYTDKGLYIGVFMQQPPDSLLARLSSRDAFLNRDSWGITLDTSGEGLYGYWFTVNLGGSVMDGKVAAERQYTNQWDGPWRSATAELADGWSAELFLPWSMMTMPDTADGARTLGFFTNRKVAYIDERWTWPALPFTSTAFMSILAKMQTPGVDPGQRLEIYPNVSYTLDEINSEDAYRAGADVSWRPSSNLQLTATINPDFGAVESDDVVVNLSSFETFFPEKRLFFLAGNEVFRTTPRARVRGRSPSGTGSRQTTSTFNPEPTTLLNTRRIGGPPRIDVPDNIDVAGVERGKPSDLLGALKLTGQSGPLRYGVLSAVEDDVRLPGVFNSGPAAGQPARAETEGREFGIARLLYETTGAGRRSIGYLGTAVRYPTHDAIVHGVDGHWLSPNGLWQLDSQFMHSDVDDETGNGGLLDVSYKPKQGVEHVLALDFLEDTLNIRDLGFIRRNDSQNVIYRYNYRTGQGLKRLRSKSRSLILSNEWNQQGRHVRAGYFFRNSWTFKNRSEIRSEFDYFPSRWDDRNSFGNGDFRVEDRFVAELAFGTDTSKKLSLSILAGMRQEELSDWTLRTAVGVTYKPNDRFSLDLDINYFDRKGWLLHQFAYGRSDVALDRNMTTFDAEEFQPRLAMDWFISAKQQLRLTLQWAGINADERDFYLIPVNGGELIDVSRDSVEMRNDFTVSRLTAQLRYRWEIAPLSDLFVVYTRGSNLPDRIDDNFDNLFSDAIDAPIVDLFVIKLRYRFGL